MPDAIAVILVTTPNAESAKQLSTSLVEQRLAACVNIIPKVNSIYRWEGNVTQAEECLLVLKTKSSLYRELEQEILKLHPYDCPEIVALTPSNVVEKYASWVSTETK